MANITIGSVKTIGDLDNFYNINADDVILAALNNNNSNVLKKITYSVLSTRISNDISGDIYGTISSISTDLTGRINTANNRITGINNNLTNNYYTKANVNASFFNKDELTGNQGELPTLSADLTTIISDVSIILDGKIDGSSSGTQAATTTQIGGFKISTDIINNNIEYQKIGLSIDTINEYGIAIMTNTAVDNILTSTTNFTNLLSLINGTTDSINSIYTNINNINENIFTVNKLNTLMLGAIMRQNYLTLSVDNEKFINYFSSLNNGNILSVISSDLNIDETDKIKERINNLTVFISAYSTGNTLYAQFNARTISNVGDIIQSNFYSRNIAGSNSILSVIQNNSSLPIVELLSKYGLDIFQDNNIDLKDAMSFIQNDYWSLKAIYNEDLLIDLNSSIFFEEATPGKKNGLLWQNINQINNTLTSICGIDSSNADELYRSLSAKIWSDISNLVVTQ